MFFAFARHQVSTASAALHPPTLFNAAQDTRDFGRLDVSFACSFLTRLGSAALPTSSSSTSAKNASDVHQHFCPTGTAFFALLAYTLNLPKNHRQIAENAVGASALQGRDVTDRESLQPTARRKRAQDAIRLSARYSAPTHRRK